MAKSIVGAAIARASANWPSIAGVPSFAIRIRMHHWQAADTPFPQKVQAKFHVRLSPGTMVRTTVGWIELSR